MTVALVEGVPEVVKAGGAVEERYDYVDGGVLAAGDLIRVTTGGEIKVSGTTSTSPPHGVSLYAVASEVNEPAPVLLFDDDTNISIPCIDGVKPTDLSKGSTYTLEKGTGGVWGITSTTTNGVATVVGYADDGIPWIDRYGSFDQDSGTNQNRVIVRITRALLDTYAA